MGRRGLAAGAGYLLLVMLTLGWSWNQPAQALANTLHLAAATMFTGAGALLILGSRIYGGRGNELLGAALAVFGLLSFPVGAVEDVLSAADPRFSSAPVLQLLSTLAALGLLAIAVWAPDLVAGIAVERLVIGTVLLVVAVTGGLLFVNPALPHPLAADRYPGWFTGTSPWLSSVSALLAMAALGFAGAQFCRATVAEHTRRTQVTRRLQGVQHYLAESDKRRQEMAHDVRNALAALRMASRLMNAGGQMDEAAHHRLGEAMAAEIEHLEALLDPEPVVQPVDFDLRSAIAPVVELQRARGAVIEVELSPLCVRGRPADVATAMQNLLVNAQAHAPGSPIRIYGRRTAFEVEVYVEDRGPGVHLEQRDRLFVRGTRSGASNGQGLGLHVSRALMRDQGGDLSLHRTSAAGTTFLLTLACASDLREHLRPTRGEPARALVPAQRSRHNSRAVHG